MKVAVSFEQREEINRAIAKSLAYVGCDKPMEAQMWAMRLIGLLKEVGALPGDAQMQSREYSESGGGQ